MSFYVSLTWEQKSRSICWNATELGSVRSDVNVPSNVAVPGKRKSAMDVKSGRVSDPDLSVKGKHNKLKSQSSQLLSDNSETEKCWSLQVCSQFVSRCFCLGEICTRISCAARIFTYITINTEVTFTGTNCAVRLLTYIHK